MLLTWFDLIARWYNESKWSIRRDRRIERIVSARTKFFRPQVADTDPLADTDDFDWDVRCKQFTAGRLRMLRGGMRGMPFSSGAALKDCYTAGYFDMSAWYEREAQILELSRFWIDPSFKPGAMQIIKKLARYIRRNSVDVCIGVSSFKLDELSPKRERGIAYIMQHCAVPEGYLFKEHADRERWEYKGTIPENYSLKQALRDIEQPALAWYIGHLDGMVSDHAVYDHDLGTLVIGTRVEIANLPPVKLQRLRKIAGDLV